MGVSYKHFHIKFKLRKKKTETDKMGIKKNCRENEPLVTEK